MQYNVTTIIDEKPLITIQNFIEYVDKNITYLWIGITLRSTETGMWPWDYFMKGVITILENSQKIYLLSYYHFNNYTYTDKWKHKKLSTITHFVRR